MRPGFSLELMEKRHPPCWVASEVAARPKQWLIIFAALWSKLENEANLEESQGRKRGGGGEQTPTMSVLHLEPAIAKA